MKKKPTKPLLLSPSMERHQIETVLLREAKMRPLRDLMINIARLFVSYLSIMHPSRPGLNRVLTVWEDSSAGGKKDLHLLVNYYFLDTEHPYTDHPCLSYSVPLAPKSCKRFSVDSLVGCPPITENETDLEGLRQLLSYLIAKEVLNQNIPELIK